MGIDFGNNLYQAEIDYLYESEWAHSAEDILWRRTKQGLRLSQAQVARVAGYMVGKCSEDNSYPQAKAG